MIEVFDIGPSQEQSQRCNAELVKHPEAFVRVHHPSCGHCKAMEQDWKGVGNNLKSNYTGNTGIFDIHAEALSNITNPALKNIDGYPTIMIIKANTPTQYNGDRSMNDMLSFALQHLTVKKKDIKKSKKKRRNAKKKRRKTEKKRKRRAKTRGGRKRRTGKR